MPTPNVKPVVALERVEEADDQVVRACAAIRMVTALANPTTNDSPSPSDVVGYLDLIEAELNGAHAALESILKRKGS